MSITPSSVVAGLPAGARLERPLRTPLRTPLGTPQVRRVRHQARESVALMAFSAATSVVVSVMLLLVVSLGR